MITCLRRSPPPPFCLYLPPAPSFIASVPVNHVCVCVRARVQAVVTVCIPSRGWRFQIRVRPTDYLTDVTEAVIDKALQAHGESVANFGADTRWELADVVGGAGITAPLLFSPTAPLYAQAPSGRQGSCGCVVMPAFALTPALPRVSPQAAPRQRNRVCGHTVPEI